MGYVHASPRDTEHELSRHCVSISTGMGLLSQSKYGRRSSKSPHIKIMISSFLRHLFNNGATGAKKTGKFKNSVVISSSSFADNAISITTRAIPLIHYSQM